MVSGKRLLVFSSKDPKARRLTRCIGDWSCLVSVAASIHEFRGKVEGGEYDMVLAEGSASLRTLIGEADPRGDILKISLAEVERRHIERVVSAAGDNKTHAAKILRIDTKTLYNKLRSYAAADEQRISSKQPASKSG